MLNKENFKFICKESIRLLIPAVILFMYIIYCMKEFNSSNNLIQALFPLILFDMFILHKFKLSLQLMRENNSLNRKDVKTKEI